MTEEDRLDTYMDTDTIIDVARSSLGISAPSSEMTDEEIAMVMKLLAESAPDTVWVDDVPMFGRIGISFMLSLSLYEFPEFYVSHGLSQFN
ncbi:hypothetical protein LCGC14_3020340 [marine sediment metagenome]|uniref:Uncharacterized protein n=1 Tax=marine sediment metagenome TaxID=412755 RepID=A0A0F8ZLN1_9ZZZZ